MVILALTVLATLSAFVYYSRMRTDLINGQLAQAKVDTLLASFQSKAYCNRHIKELFTTLPYRVYSMMFNFESIEWENQKVNLVNTPKTMPDFPRGQIHTLDLSLDGKAFKDQKMSRGEITLSYGLSGSSKIYRRSTSILLKMNSAGELVECMDRQEYRKLEWIEMGCHKLGGKLRIDSSGEHCDLASSDIIKSRTCASMNYVKRGSRCAVN